VSILSIATVLGWVFGVRVFVQLGPGIAPIQLTVLAAVGSAMVAGPALARLARAGVASRQRAANQEYIKNLSEASATFTYVLDMDSHKLIHCNHFLCQFIGYTERQIIRGGLALMRKVTHPADWAVALQHFEDIEHSSSSEVVEFEQRMKNTEGEWRWVLFRQNVLERRADGTARITRGTGQDITERKEVEIAVRQGKEILDRVIDGAAIGMALVALDGRWLRVNEALCEFLGYHSWEMLESDVQAITHPDDLGAGLAQAKQLLDGTVKTTELDKRYFRKDGAVVWATLSLSLLRDVAGEPVYFLAQILDITERRAYEELLHEYARRLENQTKDLDSANRQLQHLAAVDPLTGVFNRRMLDVRLADAFALAQRFGHPLSIIMIDVDFFKKFNDDFGHVAGDEVLRCMANILRGASRASDVVARFGGEEFAVVCPDTSISDAIALAERLRKATREFDMRPKQITCSFGVAALTVGCLEPNDLIELADSALYQAKSEGRDRVCSSNDELPAQEVRDAS